MPRAILSFTAVTCHKHSCMGRRTVVGNLEKADKNRLFRNNGNDGRLSIVLYVIVISKSIATTVKVIP